MAKIKGWTKLKRLPGELRGSKGIKAYTTDDNTRNRGAVIIFQSKSQNPNYRVIIRRNYAKFIDRTFNNKENAEKFAIAYMRRNPNG